MWHFLPNMVTVVRYEMLNAYPGCNNSSPMYKPHYQLYELHKMGQPTIVTTSLLLGDVSFVYSAIPNPLQKTPLNHS